MSLWERWKNRHRHDWIVYGGGRLCKVCAGCGEYRCEDGACGRDMALARRLVKIRRARP
jgi:hypothetical protein